ncbi:internal scaffolding protein [Microviridae sp.]|nr:internal scaffolding protein [Microviridae sp.]
MTKTAIAAYSDGTRKTIEPGGIYRIRDRVRKSFSEPSRAKQSFKDECDIHQILGKFERQGILTHVNRFQGNYGELPEMDDYHEALNTIIDAREAFETLPSQLRSRFANDPALFLEFVSDEKNAPEMVKMGLLGGLPSEDPTPPSGETKPQGGKKTPPEAPSGDEPAPSTRGATQ